MVSDGLSNGGHWFNGVVKEGELRWVDAQTGEFGGWPPPCGAFDSIEVLYRESTGSAWKELKLAQP